MACDVVAMAGALFIDAAGNAAAGLAAHRGS